MKANEIAFLLQALQPYMSTPNGCKLTEKLIAMLDAELMEGRGSILLSAEEAEEIVQRYIAEAQHGNAA